MSSITDSRFEVLQTGNVAVTMEQKPFPADTLQVTGHMHASPKAPASTTAPKCKGDDNETSSRAVLTLQEDPVPVGFANLNPPEKYQVEQDQHGGRARGEQSVQPAASLRGEVPGLRGKWRKNVSRERAGELRLRFASVLVFLLL